MTVSLTVKELIELIEERLNSKGKISTLGVSGESILDTIYFNVTDKGISISISESLKKGKDE